MIVNAILISVIFLITLENVNGYIWISKSKSQIKCYANKNNAQKSQPAVVNESKETPKKNFRINDLIQLMAMGAGAPGLGEFDRVDPETGKLFFKLEGNNLVDAKGESVQMKAKFFNDGYVEGNKDSDFNIKPPGFWSNLISGGRLQSEWEEKMNNKK